jgi:plasmid stabilization system protein ParE
VKGFRKYLIFYESLPDRVRLLRVLHGARDLPAQMGK